MLPAVRLKWRKEGDRFKAYPLGPERPAYHADVWLVSSGRNTDLIPHRNVESWAWLVCWDGWFSKSGFAEAKQAAADKANEEWWTAVDTELPRDTELEAEMIVARVLVRPMPNSLLGEDVAFLQKVLWHVHNVYRAEIKDDQAPAAVKEMVTRLSEELYRRRTIGEVAEPTVRQPRRRRR